MVIQVTVEELRTYQEKFEAWARARSDFAIATLKDGMRDWRSHGSLRESGENAAQNMEEWDRKNPTPKLIPDL